LTVNSSKEISAQIQSIQDSLDHAMAVDRHAVRCSLQRLQKRRGRRSRGSVDRQLASLRKRLQSSAARKQWRADNRPKLSYDPSLPIAAYKNDLVEAIRNHPVVIVSGETGSGKSTQIPKFCLEAGRGVDGRIGCTQPRRIAATSIAGRIAQELGEAPGKSVGYKIRFRDRVSKNAFIKIMTDGILLAEAAKDRDLTEYDTLIVDEAHERSLNIDFVLGMLKQLLQRRPDLKLIITSATIDTEKFSRAFNDAPIVEVSGRLFPVEVVYAPQDPRFRAVWESADEDPGPVEPAAEVVRRVAAGRPDGDILVFMPTEQDIRDTCEILQGALDSSCRVMPLFARLSGAEQAKVFQSTPQRKVIVATNVAETSLTIPGIKYVVDSGLARVLQYNPGTRTTALPVVPISRSCADQRMGRCGRVADGVCIRLYTEEDYRERPRFTAPEILRANLAEVILRMLAEVILRMLALRLGDVEDFPFIDPPAPRSTTDGYRLLEELGALENRKPADGNRPRNAKKGAAGRTRPLRRLTDRGRRMAGLPIDPRLGRMLIEADAEDCLNEMRVLAAALSVPEVRERPADAADAADQVHAAFYHPRSDFFTLLHIWEAYHRHRRTVKSNNQMKKYCRRNYLSYRRMREWCEIHGQLIELTKELGMQASPASISDPRQRYDAVHRAILSGFLSNIAVKREKNLYRAAKGREAMVFPGSAIFNRAGDWIVAAEMVETSRLFARTAAEIDPRWLEPLAGRLCRRAHLNPRFDPQRGEVVATEQVTLFGLLIVSGRTVSYGPIDPEQAAEVFLREALVEHRLEPQPAFLKHNRSQVNQVLRMEDRMRRRDLLVSEEERFRFYQRRLDAVYDVRTLNRILKQKGGDGFLRMHRSDLLNYQPDEDIWGRYPSRLNLGGRSFACRYRFEPGCAEDGLTVRVPSTAATAVPVEETDWLVPGLLREKIAALIRNLPKAYRKKLVPVADTVEVILTQMPRRGRGALFSRLSAFIRQRFGVDIPASAWSDEGLPDHLRMRIALTGPRGEIIESGRDTAILKQDVSGSLRLDGLQEARGKWERSDIEDWDFGDLPESIELPVSGGGSWRVFPGLAPADTSGDRVDLRIFRDPEAAVRQHRRGVEALLTRRCSRDLKFLRKSIALPAGLNMPAVRFGGLAALQSRIEAVVRRRLLRHNVRTAEDFRRHAESAAAEILPLGRRVQELATAVVEADFHARTTLARIGKANPNNSAVQHLCGRLESELDGLVPENFLELYDDTRLQQLPRYVRALELRSERAVVDIEKDRVKDAETAPFREALQEQIGRLDPSSTTAKKQALEEFFWLLEEYKVSVFAQELGTAVPASAKRLRQKLAQIERMV